MRRSVALSDFVAVRKVLEHLGKLVPDVVHCHGAKGGAYGRLIAAWLGRRRPVASVYAPHGGSLHYDESSLEGMFYFRIERMLERVTDALIHVSAYEAEVYREKIGIPRCRTAIIRNGLRDDEFTPGHHRTTPATSCFSACCATSRGSTYFSRRLPSSRQPTVASLPPTWSGRPRSPAITRRSPRNLGIADRVAFSEPMPTREAFATARMIVVPSRAESMPYVVLEAIAAGMPIIATDVGGIPEIFGPAAGALVPPGDAAALAAAIDAALADPRRTDAEAAARRAWLHPRFNISTMQNKVEALYRLMLENKYADAA